MTFLATVLRGLRSRALLSAGSVLLIALAVGSAVLGPVFSAAVTDSFLVSRLDQAPNAETGLSWRFTPQTAASDPDRAVEAAATAAGRAVPADQQRFFAAPQTFLQTDRVEAYGGAVELGAAADQCAHLDVTGRCPSAAGEVMLLQYDLDLTGTTIGQQVDLGELGTVTVVGSYRSPDADQEDYWFDLSRLAGTISHGSDDEAVYRPAPWLTVPATFAGLDPGVWSVQVDRRLDPPADLDTADLTGLDATVRALTRGTTAGAAAGDGVDDAAGGAQGGRLTWDGRTILGDVAHEVQAQRDTARRSIGPAVFSLVLVALALLLRLLSAAAGLRLPELALASLRGLPRRGMWRLGLAEPLTVLAVATPVGAALGVAGALVLVRVWLVPGLPLPLPPSAVVTGLAVVLGTALVAVLAVGQVLRVTLADQLTGVRRPRAAGRVAVVVQLVLVAAALAVVVSKLSGGSRGRPDVTDLLLPVLLAVVAGIAATRLIAAAARWWTRVRGGRSLAGFVAARAISRRTEGTLVILPVTAALAVCVFGAGVYGSAAAWRTSVAATIAPASRVYLASTTLPQAVATTHRIDPRGRYLMAVTTLAAQGPQYVIADTPRLARVATWPDQWTPGVSTATLAERLSLHARVPTVTGSTVAMSVDNGLDGGQPVTLQLTLGAPDGRTRSVFVGPFGPGSSTAAADVGFCAGASASGSADGDGCSLQGIVVGGAAATPVPMSGTIRIGALTVDGAALAGGVRGAGWVRTPGASAGDAVSVRSDGDQIVVGVESGGRSVVAQLAAGALPAALPVVAGADATLTQQGGAATSSSTAFPVRPVATARSVPLLGPVGLLIDYTTVSTDRSLLDQGTPVYVLARADTPSAVLDALRDSGATPSTTLAAEQHTLGQSAYALALRLYAVVAVLVLVMALAGLGVSTAVQLPARRRDAASLRVVGVPRRAVLSATLRELALVLGATAAAGLAAGTLAQYVVLRTVQLGYVTGINTPPLVATIDLGRLALLAVLAAVLLGAVSLASAVLTVRGARGSTLRETAR